MPDAPANLAVLVVPIPRLLDLARDRKDRTTRRYLDHEAHLTADIRAAGVRTPLKVVPEGTNYRLVCGQTRKNAAVRAGLAEVPVLVLAGEPTPTRLLVEELADNNLGERFDLLAEADIYLELMRANGWTPAELCARVPAARPPAVSKALAVFENLAAELKPRLRAGEFGPRLAYALCRLPADKQASAYQAVKDLKVEVAEAHIAAQVGGKRKPKAKPVTLRAAHGVVVTIPGGLSAEAALDDLAAMPEAVRRTQRLGLPLATAPQLLRQPTAG